MADPQTNTQTDIDLIRDFIEHVHAGEWSLRVSREEVLEALQRVGRMSDKAVTTQTQEAR